MTKKIPRDDERVVDHLQHRAVGAVGAQAEDPEGDEAELGDRRVAGDQADVGLRERHHRAVEDRGQRDQHHHLLELRGRLGKQRQHHPQEAVGADLREHRGEQDQHRQRRRAVGVRHPAVDREGRHLDQEGGGEEAEDPLLAAAREQVLLQHRDREAELADRVRGEDRGGDRADQHQQRADQRVDDHLRRRRDPVLARRRCRSGRRTGPASGRRRGRRGAGPGPRNAPRAAVPASPTRK